MKTHIQVIGWFNIVLGALSLIGGAFCALMLAIPGFFPEMRELWGVFAWSAGFLLVVSAITGIPSLVVGIGLLQGKNWSRIAAIVLAILHLVNATTLGLSTILGIYTLVILFQSESESYFTK